MWFPSSLIHLFAQKDPRSPQKGNQEIINKFRYCSLFVGVGGGDLKELDLRSCS